MKLKCIGSLLYEKWTVIKKADLFICWCHYVGISKANCAAEICSRGDAGAGQPVKEAWSCCLLVLPSVLWFSPELLVLLAGWREEPGSGKQGWAVDGVPRVLESSWEPVCGLRALAGLALCLLCLPATCRPDVVWGKVQPWSRDCWLLENNHLPLLSFHPPLLPHVVWAKLFLTVKSVFPGEVIWTYCLSFNYQQSSWAWLNVWCCCFLRLLMKACLELDEEQFCLKMLKVITFFFLMYFKVKKCKSKSPSSCSSVLDSSTQSWCALVFLLICIFML